MIVVDSDNVKFRRNYGKTRAKVPKSAVARVEKTAHEKNVKEEEFVEKKEEEIALKKAGEKETEEKEAVDKDTDENETVDKDASEVLDTAAGKETEKAAAGNKIIIIFTAHTIG
jgi:hypothetical protein